MVYMDRAESGQPPQTSSERTEAERRGQRRAAALRENLRRRKTRERLQAASSAADRAKQGR
ncbi:MAG: hypothetical protein FJX55_05140 [Alphaproteobacteria bacterium]|nr:hypothetical protein [Alphaproteobacteria bacterium]